MRATALLLLLGVAALRCSAQFWGPFGSHSLQYFPEPQRQFNGGRPDSGWQSPWSDGGGALWQPERARRPPAPPVPGEDQPVLWPNDPSPPRPAGGRRRPNDPMTDSRSNQPSRNQPRRPTRPTRPATSTVEPAADDAAPCGKIVFNRIINGKNASRGQFPWQAALIYSRGGRQSVLCGGALISPLYVLTAAHCLNPSDIRGWTLEAVRLGALLSAPDAQEPGMQTMKVARQVLHPQYTRNGVRNVRNANDIALLRLDRPAPYTSLIRPVCLPEQNQRNSAIMNSEPQSYLVAGWGKTEDLVGSPNLKVAVLVPEDPEDCGQKLEGVTIPSYQLCAIGKNKEDSCDGDSGGPLITSSVRPDSNDNVFQVEGIVSFGQRNCLEGNPGAYTRVASYLDWIHQTMQQ